MAMCAVDTLRWNGISGDWAVTGGWATGSWDVITYPTPLGDWSPALTGPVANETRAILFDSSIVDNNTTRVVSFNPSTPVQVLSGGLYFLQRNTIVRSVEFQLEGTRLVLDGGELVFYGAGGTSGERPMTSFHNGTVQIGGEDEASIWLGIEYVGQSSVNHHVEFAAGSVLDTHNTKEILVSGISSQRTRNYVLDLSQAALYSGALSNPAEREGALVVSGNIGIGVSSQNSLHATTGKESNGKLLLGDVKLIRTGEDLIVGQYQRTAAGNAIEYTVSGELDFTASSYVEPVVLDVGRDLRIGVGDRAQGEIQNAPVMEVTVGSLASRGVIYVGYKNQSHSTLDNGVTAGSFVTQGGTFNAWLTELRIGENTENRVGGSTTGVLGFGDSDLGVLNIDGDAVIGRGLRASGSFSLKGGLAQSNNLVVGDTTGTELVSLLSLNGTTWEVENTLLVGENGRIEIILNGGSGGLDFLLNDSNSLQIEEGGVIDVRFDQDAGSEHLWGIRIGGDHKDYLESFLNSGLIASGTYGSSAQVFTDGSYTYYGITAIPETSTISLFILTALGLFWIQSRKTSVRV